MQTATLVGIDLGKHSFHLHGQDRLGKVVFRKKANRKQLIELLSRLEVCTVVMESCAGAHYMARKLASLGHHVKLISPQSFGHSSKATRIYGPPRFCNTDF